MRALYNLEDIKILSKDGFNVVMQQLKTVTDDSNITQTLQNIEAEINRFNGKEDEWLFFPEEQVVLPLKALYAKLENHHDSLAAFFELLDGFRRQYDESKTFVAEDAIQQIRSNESSCNMLFVKSCMNGLFLLANCLNPERLARIVENSNASHTFDYRDETRDIAWGAFIKWSPLIFGFCDDSNAIAFAAKRGDLEAVRVLLSDSMFDPSASDNTAINAAAEMGHTEVVRLLLTDKRVDASYAPMFAISAGRLEIVRLLLSNNWNPAAKDNFALQFAAAKGELGIVFLLATHKGLFDKYADDSVQLLAESTNTKIIAIGLESRLCQERAKHVSYKYMFFSAADILPEIKQNIASFMAKSCTPKLS